MTFKESTQNKINEAYPKVCNLVEQGLTIKQALDKVNVDRSQFYKAITKQQFLELQMIKTTNTIYGIGGSGKAYK